MRQVWSKFHPESFFEFGFPYAGELSCGWRSGLMDTGTLMQVIDELSRRALPLMPEETEISFRLSDEVDAVRGIAGGLQKYEKSDSCDIWQYYVVAAIGRATMNPETRFDLLDSAWADLGYPEEMRDVIYPEGGMPSHLDTEAGDMALAEFMHKWHERLSRRVPESRTSDT
ncbi:hypothetical protein ABZX77_09970 [Streptomyces sp. NPDC004237]|uniref:hypothetical protein n=1 Tax=Streptomyces sp. NPDC004237 TaxID=3154455 RepID=UPI0033B39CA6